MQEFDVGDRIKITATFSLDLIPTDATLFTITIQDPEGIETVVDQTYSGLIHTASGVYMIRTILDKQGFWSVMWKGTGNIITAGEDSLRVRYSTINRS